MADTFHVVGLSELNRRLKELPAAIARNVLKNAVSAAASVIRKEAQARAPVDTGTLRRAIYQKQIRELSSLTQQTYFVGVRSGKQFRKVKGTNKKKFVNGDAFYWRHVEFGTRFMSARPFLRPAFESRKTEALQALKTRLEIGIDRQVKKLGGT